MLIGGSGVCSVQVCFRRFVRGDFALGSEGGMWRGFGSRGRAAARWRQRGTDRSLCAPVKGETEGCTADRLQGVMRV
jgi:hypothetical protein